MAGSTIDHMISLIVFLGALLLFISLFNQTIQTAVLFQRNRYTAIKCSDLLDNILLNPGIPEDWSRMDVAPSGFGLQDPEFTQYKLSPFALMHLNYSAGEPVYYPKTGQWYSNTTIGFGESLLVPFNEAVDCQTAATLLGINGTFGFRLTITPIVNVSITPLDSPDNPSKLAVNVRGSGFSLAGAEINYCLITVKAGGGAGQYPSYEADYGTSFTDASGSATLSLNETGDSYVLIVYAHLSGLFGVGCYEHVAYKENYVVPFISNFEDGEVLLAHSWDVHGGDDPAEITYNATFVLLTEDFKLRELPLGDGKIGKLNYGQDPKIAYVKLKIPTYSSGVLVVSYRKSAQDQMCGVVMMPWGISTLAFPVIFGEDPMGKTWVATDVRQVTVNGITYQAVLALWSQQGYQVVG
jgi:hypothetical protein